MRKKNVRAFPHDPDTLALLRNDDGTFTVSGGLPPWFEGMFPGRSGDGGPLSASELFPFLDVFLDFPEGVWPDVADQPAESDVWTQSLPDGSEIQLAATATVSSGRRVLTIRPGSVAWRERRSIIQKARETNLDRGALRRSAKFFEQSHAGLSLVLSHLPAVVWTTGPDLCISAVYGAQDQVQTVASHLKSSVDGLVGMPIEQIFNDDILPVPVAAAHRLAIEGIGVDFEFQAGDIPFECHLEPMHGPDGSVSGLVGIARDVSQQREAQRQKILAVQEEERAVVAEGHVRELKAEIGARLKAEKKLKAAMNSLNRTLESAILAMARALETRDAYTAGHQQRVAVLSREIAREMGLSAEKAHQIYLTALIHDLGKIAVPFEILGKPGPLTPLEFEIVRVHPAAGWDILSAIPFPWPLAKIVRQHHECLDGSGYPDGLKGDEIMLEARIISVADIIESIGSHRPYRPSMGLDAAFNLVLEGRGIRYDPDVVDACVRVFSEKDFSFE